MMESSTIWDIILGILLGVVITALFSPIISPWVDGFYIKLGIFEEPNVSAKVIVMPINTSAYIPENVELKDSYIVYSIKFGNDFFSKKKIGDVRFNMWVDGVPFKIKVFGSSSCKIDNPKSVVLTINSTEKEYTLSDIDKLDFAPGKIEGRNAVSIVCDTMLPSDGFDAYIYVDRNGKIVSGILGGESIYSLKYSWQSYSKTNYNEIYGNIDFSRVI